MGPRGRLCPHFGEETPLVGRSGSGTIFFCGCNLACVFCQDYDIGRRERQGGLGGCIGAHDASPSTSGCHNINFVTPTHVVPQILEALVLAREDGLSIPLVYNSGGYDSVETLRLLEGIFDIYMPDAKYGSDEAALEYSNAPDYTGIMKEAIREMHRQVGDLVLDRGRHRRSAAFSFATWSCLEAPPKLRNSALPGESPDTYLNVIAQYRPEYDACRFPELCPPLREREYAHALHLAAARGTDARTGNTLMPCGPNY